MQLQQETIRKEILINKTDVLPFFRKVNGATAIGEMPNEHIVNIYKINFASSLVSGFYAIRRKPL